MIPEKYIDSPEDLNHYITDYFGGENSSEMIEIVWIDSVMCENKYGSEYISYDVMSDRTISNDINPYTCSKFMIHTSIQSYSQRGILLFIQ